MTVARLLAATVRATIVQASDAASQRTAVRSRSLAPPARPARQARLPTTKSIAMSAAIGASVTSPASGQARTRQATIPNRTGRPTADGSPPPAANARAARVSEKSLPSS